MSNQPKGDQLAHLERQTSQHDKAVTQRVEQTSQQLQDAQDLRADEVARVSGLDLLKLVEGTHDPQAARNKIKGALGELAMQDILQRDYAFAVEYEPVYLKPEESVEEHHRLSLRGKRPDAVVFSGAGSDRGEISHVLDSKAWSEVSLTLGKEQLQKRAEAYAALPELSQDGKIIFALPNDTLEAQPALVDEIKAWKIGKHAVEIIPLGRTNAELNAETQAIIATLHSWTNNPNWRGSTS